MIFKNHVHLGVVNLFGEIIPSKLQIQYSEWVVVAISSYWTKEYKLL